MSRCYAERQAARFSGPGQPYEGLVRLGKNGPRWTGKTRIVRERLEDPLRWSRPRRIFVNSMSDLFHESIPDHEIANVFAIMESARSRGHIFQVLTKRAKRMREWVTDWAAKIDYADDSGRGYAGRYGHVWLGVSVEDQHTADERIEQLAMVPGVVRFVSYEPALAQVNLIEWLGGAVQWVIVGGESGPEARPFDPFWAYFVVTQCRIFNVPVFVKQLGAQPIGLLLKDRKGGDMSEWPDGLRVREFPACDHCHPALRVRDFSAGTQS